MCNFNSVLCSLTCSDCKHFSGVEQWGYCNIRYHREVWSNGSLTVKQVKLNDEPACFKFQPIDHTTQPELPSNGAIVSREPRPNQRCYIEEV